MTIDQRARAAAEAVRTARAAAQFTVSPPPAERRPGPRRPLTLAAAGFALALLIAVPAVLLTGDVLDPGDAAVPPSELDDGIRYVKTLVAMRIGAEAHERHIEQWMSPDGRAVAASSWEAGLPTDPTGPLSAARAVQPLDAPTWTVSDPTPPPVPFGFADRTLPTDPAALEDALVSGPGLGAAFFGPGGDGLTGDGSTLDRNGRVLRRYPDMMTPVLDPTVAAAFYELAAGLDGAVVDAGAADPLGRTAVAVTVPVSVSTLGGDPVGTVHATTWFAPDTKLMLAQVWELVEGELLPSSDASAILLVVAERGIADALPTPQPEPRDPSPSTTVATGPAD